MKLYVINCYNRSIHSKPTFGSSWSRHGGPQVQRDYSSGPTVFTGIPGGIAGESACSLCHRSFVENSMGSDGLGPEMEDFLEFIVGKTMVNSNSTMN